MYKEGAAAFVVNVLEPATWQCLKTQLGGSAGTNANLATKIIMFIILNNVILCILCVTN